MSAGFQNPFRPGNGHPPPYLAGRAAERTEFARLLEQSPILKNAIFTGLRGVGKTVLLNSLRPVAREKGWLWVGSELSEDVALAHGGLATRILADVAPITSGVTLPAGKRRSAGFAPAAGVVREPLTYDRLAGIHESVPGLPLDKIKHVLALTWQVIAAGWPDTRGVVFAYDEAQNLENRPDRDQFPMSLLLDAFGSLQRQGLPLMLALSGLPTLFPALVRARTSAERMFRVLFLERLSPGESAEAIRRPLEALEPRFRLNDQSVERIVEMSGGYPYFIQFIAREAYDAFIQRRSTGRAASVPANEIERKLDNDFFAGRWSRATDRQRELLWVIAHLDGADGEFTVQSVVEKGKAMLARPFSASHANQMLVSLSAQGLIFKNRHGRYSFAVPLLDRFIRRQPAPADPA